MSASVYIYLITNLVNGKQYVGQTIDIQRREGDHRRSNGGCSHLHSAIRKYGWSNFAFDVIFEHDDEDFVVNTMEPLFIEWYDTKENGYNLTDGGGGTSGYKHPPRKLTESHRSSISEGLKGHKVSEETKKLLSSALKGNRNFEGHPHTEETKKLLSEQKAKTWYIVSPEGENIEVTNLRSFCLNNNMSPSAMSRVVNGKQRHHKGWTRQSPSDTSASE